MSHHIASYFLDRTWMKLYQQRPGSHGSTYGVVTSTATTTGRLPLRRTTVRERAHSVGRWDPTSNWIWDNRGHSSSITDHSHTHLSRVVMWQRREAQCKSVSLPSFSLSPPPPSPLLLLCYHPCNTCIPSRSSVLTFHTPIVITPQVLEVGTDSTSCQWMDWEMSLLFHTSQSWQASCKITF